MFCLNVKVANRACMISYNNCYVLVCCYIPMSLSYIRLGVH